MYSVIRHSLFCLVCIVVFNSCKNDLKIIAPYKEVPSVYAVLTPQEPIQMIRINKVFLGEGDANVMAKVTDSVNYKPGELSVMLERFVNGSKTVAGTTYTGNVFEVLFHDSVIQTQEGAFSTTQRVYVTNNRLFSSGEYKLTITNNNTGNVFTAKTNAIDSVLLSNYSPFTYPFSPVPYSPSNPPSYYVDYSNVNVNFTIRTKQATGGFLHDLTIRVLYFDSISGGKINNVLDYVFNPQQPYQMVPFSASSYFNFTFKGSNLFSEYANMMVNRPNPVGFLGRKAYRVDFIAYATTQDYYDYLQFAAPSLSFAQEKILYSNFDKRAAMGLFTFRSRCWIKKDMATAFVDAFAYNANTCKYRFYTAGLTLPGCP